jgi:hypothetical protein
MKEYGMTILPLRSTNPSTTGVTLAMACPTSITSPEAFPAANLSRVYDKSRRGRESATHVLRTPVLAM